MSISPTAKPVDLKTRWGGVLSVVDQNKDGKVDKKEATKSGIDSQQFKPGSADDFYNYLEAQSRAKQGGNPLLSRLMQFKELTPQQLKTMLAVLKADTKRVKGQIENIQKQLEADKKEIKEEDKCLAKQQEQLKLLENKLKELNAAFKMVKDLLEKSGNKVLSDLKLPEEFLSLKSLSDVEKALEKTVKLLDKFSQMEVDEKGAIIVPKTGEKLIVPERDYRLSQKLSRLLGINSKEAMSLLVDLRKNAKEGKFQGSISEITKNMNAFLKEAGINLKFTEEAMAALGFAKESLPLFFEGKLDLGKFVRRTYNTLAKYGRGVNLSELKGYASAKNFSVETKGNLMQKGKFFNRFRMGFFSSLHALAKKLEYQPREGEDRLSLQEKALAQIEFIRGLKPEKIRDRLMKLDKKEGRLFSELRDESQDFNKANLSGHIFTRAVKHLTQAALRGITTYKEQNERLSLIKEVLDHLESEVSKHGASESRALQLFYHEATKAENGGSFSIAKILQAKGKSDAAAMPQEIAEKKGKTEKNESKS